MLTRLISLLRAWLAPAPKARRCRIGSALEPLEDRIAPATLVSPHIVTYTDTHGDLVTIKSSASIFTAANVNNILVFDTGSVDGSTIAQQLRAMDIGTLAPNDNISITVKGSIDAANLPYVGRISSTDALGKVLVQGDLTAIDAGTTNISGGHYTGLASLTVNSFGTQGVSTLPINSKPLSAISGNVGSIKIIGEMGVPDGTAAGPQIIVSANSAGITGGNGNVGSITIGGSLNGGANALDASITVQGNVGSVSIAGDMKGGAGSNSASFQIGGKIGKFSVDNITGYKNTSTGAGAGSASIVTGTQDTVAGIGSLTVKGNITGGEGAGSAFIGESAAGNSPTVFSGGAFGTIKIGGFLKGGSGANSGEINANSFGAITIAGADDGGTVRGIVGSSGASSGLISSVGGIASLTIKSGGIVGGTAKNSGSVLAATSPFNAANFGTIVVHGDITGDNTAVDTITGAGQISTQSSIGSVTVYGSLIGTSSVSSGSILATEAIGHVTLKAEGTSEGSLLGGTGSNSGEITALSISSVNIAGKIMGNTATSGTDIGAGSGKISTTLSAGSISIGAGLLGGIGDGSGALDIGSGFGAHLTSLIIKSGGITAGTGANTGLVDAGGPIGSINLNGSSITAGATAGAGSGGILASDNVGSISIGSLVLDAGAGVGAGQISVGGNLSSLKFTGVIASTTTVTGMVNVAGSVGSISVHGDVVGAGDSTGAFVIGGAVKSISITGSLRGGTGTDSGAIFAGLDDVGKISSLTVTGDITGNTGDGSGQVFGGGGITKASIGNLLGNVGMASGSISSDGALGAISVKGATGIQGGSGDGSGQISAGSTIKSVNVTGSLAGGAGLGSGSIVSHSIFGPGGDLQGDIGSITIGGSIIGGANTDSGQVSAAGDIGSISVKTDVQGAAFSGTGAILAGMEPTTSTGGAITTLKIGGTLHGANVNGGSPVTVNGSGYIEAARIGSATIGSIQAGVIGAGNTVTADGAILAANDIASLTVTGGITGDVTNPVVISAVGEANPGKTDLAFGKINIGSGGVVFANFLAGYDQTGAGVNGAASIGTVTDSGDWSHSNLVAAVLAASGKFGDSGTKLITSDSSVIPSIASIIIKGHVTSLVNGISDPALADTYGFVAKEIKSFSVGGQKQSLALGFIGNVDQSTDTDVREVT